MKIYDSNMVYECRYSDRLIVARYMYWEPETLNHKIYVYWDMLDNVGIGETYIDDSWWTLTPMMTDEEFKTKFPEECI